VKGRPGTTPLSGMDGNDYLCGIDRGNVEMRTRYISQRNTYSKERRTYRNFEPIRAESKEPYNR
jgi:hypothetical protein